jgi:cobalamin biosynthesis protein CbiG
MRLVLGVGLASAADPAQLRELTLTTLRDGGFCPADVCTVATLATKAQLPAVSHLARALGACINGHPAATLAAHRVPSPSGRVAATVGTPSVAEAAVLAEGAVLVVAKTGLGLCTVAVGRLDPATAERR